jgi:hypothetical protein
MRNRRIKNYLMDKHQMNIKELQEKLKEIEGCLIEKANGGSYKISYADQIWEIIPPKLINVIKSDFLSNDSYYMPLDLFYRRCITREFQAIIKKNSYKVWNLKDTILIKKLIAENNTIDQIVEALERELNPKLISNIYKCLGPRVKISEESFWEAILDKTHIPIQDLATEIEDRRQDEYLKNYDPLDPLNL